MTDFDVLKGDTEQPSAGEGPTAFRQLATVDAHFQLAAAAARAQAQTTEPEPDRTYLDRDVLERAQVRVGRRWAQAGQALPGASAHDELNRVSSEVLREARAIASALPAPPPAAPTAPDVETHAGALIDPEIVQGAYQDVQRRWAADGRAEALDDPTLEEQEQFWTEVNTAARIAAFRADTRPAALMQRATGRVWNEWASSHEGAWALENPTTESEGRFWARVDVVAADLAAEAGGA